MRTPTLKAIGGLGPELAEDHSTTLKMNAGGWGGVCQPDAIAHVDGPETCLDAMLQEFHWPRSLMLILLQLTPQCLPSHPTRKSCQFLFPQV